MAEQERYTDYIHSLQSVLSEELEAFYRKALADGIPVIRPSAQSLLRFLLLERQPERILEIGSGIGFSAVFMSGFLPEGGRIITIEKDPARAEKARENIAAFRKEDTITFLEGDAAERMEEFSEESFDLIFLDAAKGQYIRFLPRVKSLLRSGGLLVSDNVLRGGQIIESHYGVCRRDRTIHKRMREFLAAITKDEELVTTILSEGDGMALSLKR